MQWGLFERDIQVPNQMFGGDVIEQKADYVLVYEAGNLVAVIRLAEGQVVKKIADR